MRRILPFLLAALALPTSASATWSVIAVDGSTGRVVIASATCVDRDDQFLKACRPWWCPAGAWPRARPPWI